MILWHRYFARAVCCSRTQDTTANYACFKGDTISLSKKNLVSSDCKKKKIQLFILVNSLCITCNKCYCQMVFVMTMREVLVLSECNKHASLFPSYLDLNPCYLVWTCVTWFEPLLLDLNPYHLIWTRVTCFERMLFIVWFKILKYEKYILCLTGSAKLGFNLNSRSTSI